MKNPIKTWRLKTHDNIVVSGDGKGRYTLEYLPDCAAVKFREGEQADDDMEILGEEIGKLFRCQVSLGPGSEYLRMIGLR
jgi:hypothetical protein